MRQLELRTFNPTITLAAGLVVGLVIGLLIGWVFWPVEWQGATINELYPDAKAEYLATVADGYVMYSTPEAAATAQRRVANFGPNLASEIEAAIAHYSASSDPDKAVRISNLTSLAAALGVTLPNLVGLAPPDSAAAPPPQAEGAEPTQAPTAAPLTPQSSEPVEVDSGGMGWVGWLFGILAALVLVLGGVYLLLMLNRRTAQPGSGDEGMDEVINQEIGSIRADGERYTAAQRYVAGNSPTAPAEATPYSERVAQAMATLPEEPDEYQFDDDPEDYTTFATGGTSRQAGHYTQFSLGPSRQPDPVEDEEVDEDWSDDEEDYAAPPSNQPASSTAALQPSPSLPSPAATQETNAANRAASRATTITRGSSRYKLLEIYTAHYQAGIHDYDESHPITDPLTAKYIGECGMGVSTKNGLLQNHPDQVVALEVWLFDKTDDKNIGSQTRVLLSEYAIDHNLDQAFLRERQDDPRPFTAQPNVRFQLESQNLLLDCTIVEAIYTPSGPTKGTFQSVQIDMHVHKKI